MSAILDVREMRMKRKAITDQAGAILSTAHREKRKITPEEMQEFEKRHAEGDALYARIETAMSAHQRSMENDLLEVRSDSRTAGRENYDSRQAPGYQQRDLPPATTERREGFTPQQIDVTRRWMYGGNAALDENERRQHFRSLGSDEQRALTTLTSSSGGATVPQGFVYTLEVALKYYGGIIQAADYIDTPMGNDLPWPSLNDTQNTAEIIAENQPVMGASGGAAETDPTYGAVTFHAYVFDSGIIKVPVTLLQDSAFNVDTYLNEQLQIRIGRKLNAKCTTGAGSGSSEPQGVVTGATLGKTAASPTTVTYNELLDLEHSVDPAYRERGAFMFNDLTLKAVKKLTDGNSRPLWIAGGVSEGIQNRRPDTIDGYRYWINQDMATMASSAKSVLFGDFSKFKIRRVRELQMVRFAERFMDNLQAGYLCWQRYDGGILDAGTHPISYLQQSAT